MGDELFQASTSQLSFEKFINTINQDQAKDLVRGINQFMKKFRSRPADNETDSRDVQDFLSSMEQSFARHPLWVGCTRSELENAVEGLEKYLMTKLYDRTFGLDPLDRERDAVLSRRLAALVGFVTPVHLEVSEQLRGPLMAGEVVSVAAAAKELKKMTLYKSPRDKLVQILNCCKIINDFLTSWRAGAGADDFTPTLIYVTIKAQPEALASNLAYIERYRHSSRLSGEAAYFFVQMQGAVAFLETLSPTSLAACEPDEFIAHMLATGAIQEAELSEEQLAAQRLHAATTAATAAAIAAEGAAQSPPQPPPPPQTAAAGAAVYGNPMLAAQQMHRARPQAPPGSYVGVSYGNDGGTALPTPPHPPLDAPTQQPMQPPPPPQPSNYYMMYSPGNAVYGQTMPYYMPYGPTIAPMPYGHQWVTSAGAAAAGALPPPPLPPPPPPPTAAAPLPPPPPPAPFVPMLPKSVSELERDGVRLVVKAEAAGELRAKYPYLYVTKESLTLYDVSQLLASYKELVVRYETLAQAVENNVVKYFTDLEGYQEGPRQESMDKTSSPAAARPLPPPPPIPPCQPPPPLPPQQPPPDQQNLISMRDARLTHPPPPPPPTTTMQAFQPPTDYAIGTALPPPLRAAESVKSVSTFRSYGIADSSYGMPSHQLETELVGTMDTAAPAAAAAAASQVLGQVTVGPQSPTSSSVATSAAAAAAPLVKSGASLIDLLFDSTSPQAPPPFQPPPSLSWSWLSSQPIAQPPFEVQYSPQPPQPSPPTTQQQQLHFPSLFNNVVGNHSDANQVTPPDSVRNTSVTEPSASAEVLRTSGTCDGALVEALFVAAPAVEPLIAVASSREDNARGAATSTSTSDIVKSDSLPIVDRNSMSPLTSIGQATDGAARKSEAADLASLDLTLAIPPTMMSTLPWEPRASFEERDEPGAVADAVPVQAAAGALERGLMPPPLLQEVPNLASVDELGLELSPLPLPPANPEALSPPAVMDSSAPALQQAACSGEAVIGAAATTAAGGESEEERQARVDALVQELLGTAGGLGNEAKEGQGPFKGDDAASAAAAAVDAALALYGGPTPVTTMEAAVDGDTDISAVRKADFAATAEALSDLATTLVAGEPSNARSDRDRRGGSVAALDLLPLAQNTDAGANGDGSSKGGRRVAAAAHEANGESLFGGLLVQTPSP